MKYIKRMEVEAIQFTGDNISEIKAFDKEHIFKYNHNNKCISIPTVQGIMIAGIGDFIIRNIYNEYYSRNSKYFYENYKKVR